MKKTSPAVIAATLLVAATQTVSADTLLTDDFTVTSNSQDVNQELAGRQTGTMAPSTYTLGPVHHQVGNPETNVGQPGGATYSNYLLIAFNGWTINNLDIAAAATGPLSIGFDMYFHNAPNRSTDNTQWGAFTLRGLGGEAWPIAGGGEFAFLNRYNGGIQVFQDGSSSITPGGWDTEGFALADRWTLTFSDTAGTGSAFNGNGSQVTFENGATTLGTITLGQLNSSGLYFGFRNYNDTFVGVDNLAVTLVPEPSAALLIPAGFGLLALLRRYRHVQE